MIEIKRHGSYLDVDNDGFVVPIVSTSLFQSEWKLIVDEVVGYYQKTLEENLHSVYIRGSVPKGEAVPFISDLDSFCVTHNSEPELVDKDKLSKHLKEKYPFCEHTELVALGIEELHEDIPPRNRGIWDELVKTQSVCVFGQDLAETLEPFLLEDMIGHSYFLENDLEKLPGFFEEDGDSVDEITSTCTWISRRIVRSGFDLVMMQENKFTRDLYLCWESFSKYYPEHKTNMYAILNLALNPVSDVEQIKATLEKITPWLVLEIRRNLLN